MIGKSVAHYRITELLGEGGMGQVYRARDTKLDRDVALKVLPEAFTKDPQRMARFEREARVLASLNHSNIGSIYGLESSEEGQVLVLELIEGETLADRISRGPIPIQEALQLARQIAEALEAAHARGIIHRDLKPANVKITPEGQVKVLDFGLAKAADSERSEQSAASSPTLTLQATQVGMLLGTAAYMAPEQAKGKVVDKRADIWAFGVVLYEMLSGQRAFSGGDITEVLASVIKVDVDWELLPEETPPVIQKWLRRCLEPNLKRRLQDVGDFRLEIDDFLENPESGSVVAPSRATALPARSPWLLAGVAALVTAGLVLFLTSFFQPVEKARRPIRLSTRLTTDEPLFLSQGSAVLLSPDGSRLLFSAGARRTSHLHLRNLDQQGDTEIQGTTDAQNPFFSPDGEWIGFFDETALKKVSVRGGIPSTLCATDTSTRGGTWGEKGMIVFNGGSARGVSGGLMIISEAGGTPQTLTEPAEGEGAHVFPSFLPGGSQVLFTVLRPSKTPLIQSVHIETGKVSPLIEDGSYARYSQSGHLLFVRNGTLFGVAFEPTGLSLAGEPIPLVENIAGNTGSSHYDVSKDGTLVYVQDSAAGGEILRSLVWYSEEGSTVASSVQGQWSRMSLAPDGNHLTVSRARGDSIDIWALDLTRDVATRLTSDDENDQNPVWSPADEMIYFSRQGRLFRVPADGSSAATPLDFKTEAFLYPSDFSEQERLLVATSARGGQDIWLIPVDGGEPRVFLDTEFSERDATFSPDSQWLAYDSEESGDSQIYLRSLSGTGGKSQVSTGGGRMAQWDAEGNLYYVQPDGTIMKVAIDFTSGRPRIGTPKAMLMTGSATYGSRQSWVVHPDGERILRVVEGENFGGDSQVNRVHFVINWFTELEELMK